MERRMFKKIGVALAFTLIASAVHANDLPQYPFVHTSGSANINVVPDVGEIDMELTSADQNAEAAWAVIEARLAEVRAHLAQQGLTAADVDVQSITRKTRKQEGVAVGAPAGFDTLCTLHLTVRDLSKWAELVGPLLKMPELTEFGVTFSRSDRRKIETELVASAMADARRKADDLARGAGRQLGQASGIALVPIRNLSTVFGLSSAEGSGQRGRGKDTTDYTLVGVVRLVQNVDVIFKLK
jgi:uncharacterized protein YggE